MQPSFVSPVLVPRRPRHPLGGECGRRVWSNPGPVRSTPRWSMSGSSRNATERAEYAQSLRTLRALRAREAWPRVIRVCAEILDGPVAPFVDGRFYAELFYAWMKRSWRADAVDATAMWNDLCVRERSASLLGPRAYMSVIQLLAKHNLVDDAIRIRRMGKAFGFVLNRYVYNAFLNACAKRARLDEAFCTLEEMAIAKVIPDVVSFNCVISCCINAGDLDMALTLLERMREWGIEPDIYSLNSIVNGLRKAGRLDAAFQLVAKMEIEAAEAYSDENEADRPANSDAKCPSTVMEGDDCKEGMQWDQEVDASGATTFAGTAAVSPDLVTYNTLLAGLANEDPPALRRALRLKRHMERRGLVCNEVTFNALMAAAARGDHIKDAFAIYSEMLSSGIRPNCECFTTLITLCARAKMVDRAFIVHNHMVEIGIRPSVVTYNSLITATRHVLDADRALGVLAKMKETPGCEPDVITYSTIIDTLGRSGRLEEVNALLKDMERSGVEPNLVTYTSVIAARTRAGDLEAAMRTLDEMEERGIEPNVYTFSSLINGAGRAGCFEKAFELLAMMRGRGIRPTCVTYITLIQTSVRAESAEHFHRALKELGEDDIIRDQNMYQNILAHAREKNVFGREGRAELDALVAEIRDAATQESWGGLSRKPPTRMPRKRTGPNRLRRARNAPGKSARYTREGGSMTTVPTPATTKG